MSQGERKGKEKKKPGLANLRAQRFDSAAEDHGVRVRASLVNHEEGQ